MGDALKPEYEGRAAIADGSTGALVIDPDDDTRDRLMKKRDEQLRLQRLLETLKGQANVTKDGKTIRIYCNIGSPEDVHAVQVNDGGGIGLFRSEFLYLNSSTFPTEDEQFEAYKQVLSDMDGKEVIIRTLDIGADKQIGYFDLPKEDNPAMGMRALRICLTRPEIFRTQLRALFRASAYGKLGIMFPMVTSVWEVREAKKLCEEVKRDLKHEGIPLQRGCADRHHDRDPGRRHQQRPSGQGSRLLQHRHQRPDPVHPGLRPPEQRPGPLLRPAPSRRAAPDQAGHRERPQERHLGRHLRRAGR